MGQKASNFSQGCLLLLCLDIGHFCLEGKQEKVLGWVHTFLSQVSNPHLRCCMSLGLKIPCCKLLCQVRKGKDHVVFIPWTGLIPILQIISQCTLWRNFPGSFPFFLELMNVPQMAAVWFQSNTKGSHCHGKKHLTCAIQWVQLCLLYWTSLCCWMCWKLHVHNVHHSLKQSLLDFPSTTWFHPF